MQRNRGKATRSAHAVAATKPHVKALIEELAKNFEDWPSAVRRKKINTLLAIEDISIRGLAGDTKINNSTLRYYRDTSPRAKQVELPRKQTSLAKPSVQIAGAPRPSVVEQKASAPKVAPLRKVDLPPRPERMIQRQVRQAEHRELAKLLLEFLETQGTPLGFRYPSDIHVVLSDLRSLMNDLPDSPNLDMGSIPMSDERSELFDEISMGAGDCDRSYRLAVGLRNLMKQLGGNRSTWENALSEVRGMSEDVARQSTLQQPTSLPGEQPIKRTAEIRWTSRWGRT